MKWIALIIVLIIVCMGLATIYGKFRWQLDTDNLRAKLGSGQRIIKPQIYDQKEIEGLPAPVQRFFRTVFKDGQPIASAVKFTHQGEFNMGEKKAKWSPFTSTQLVVTQRPGFDWDARIQMAPGLKIFRFNTEGSIDTIRAEARYRTVGDTLVRMPWECRLCGYTVRNGMQIPLEGEVAWQPPEGAWPYWRGRITEINHEFAPPTGGRFGQ